MRYCTNKEQHAYVKERQEQLKSKGMSLAELGAWRELKKSGLKWTWQACLGGPRIVDFWCALKGAVVEIDGKEHDAVVDAIRDAWLKMRREIVVFRVPNYDDRALHLAVLSVQRLDDWSVRLLERPNNVRKRETRRTLGLAHGDWVPGE